MSRKSTFSGNHQAFNDQLNHFLSNRPSRGGLPEQIFVTALSDYEYRNLRWHEVINKSDDVEKMLAQEMPDYIIDKQILPGISVKSSAIGLGVYHVNALSHTNSEVFFGAYMDAFIFKRNKVMILQTFDPVGVTGHLHRRMMSRTVEGVTSFSDFHMKLSNFWPILIEVGNRRKSSGARANVNHFMMPLGDGLAFGELQKVEAAFLFAPEYWICRRGTVMIDRLPDNLTSHGSRLLVYIRTVYARNRMNAKQKLISSMLQHYAERHEKAISTLRKKFLYAGGAHTDLSIEFEKVFLSDKASDREINDAVLDFERLSNMTEWQEEIHRSQSTIKSSNVNEN